MVFFHLFPVISSSRLGLNIEEIDDVANLYPEQLAKDGWRVGWVCDFFVGTNPPDIPDA